MDIISRPAATRPVAFTTDGGIAARAAIGLIVLGTDQTIEHEYRMMLTLPGVAVYESRIWNDATITPETLRAMDGGIAEAARLILPGMKLDVVGFGCTSATMVLGEAQVGARIHEARPGVAVTTPVTAAFAAFRALRAQRIAVLTPYAPAVNEGIRAYIEAAGFSVCAMASFNEPDDRIVARISEASIADAAASLVAGSGAQALFVSCTSLRLVEQIAALEARIGIPATSSNHAMGWHSLRLAGVADRLRFGRLFTLAPD
jgi:maleate isomerase